MATEEPQNEGGDGAVLYLRSSVYRVREASDLVEFYTSQLGFSFASASRVSESSTAVLLRPYTTPPPPPTLPEGGESSPFESIPEGGIAMAGPGGPGAARPLPPMGLEFWNDESVDATEEKYKHDSEKDGYWKIGLTMPHLGAFASWLKENGTDVPPPNQFKDVGYMSHIADPNGFSIELLQHDFTPTAIGEEGGEAVEAEPPHLAHLTLRVRSLQPALDFYRGGLGMHLIDTIRVEDYKFTLYFLAFAEEAVPEGLEVEARRSWLFSRPYTTLELVCRDRTEGDGEFRYAVPKREGEGSLGWQGMCIGVRHCATPGPAATDLTQWVEGLKQRLIGQHGGSEGEEGSVLDPDGYTVRFKEDLG